MEIFKRKVYEQLLEWKNKYSNDYALLLEGMRRVGKSTIAEEFAKKEFKTYILIDFSIAQKKILDFFDDIDNLDIFFLELASYFNVTLYKGESLIIFDEIQFFPKARQAIKHLVKDGRYHFLETGSLISIKRNTKDILIPSEEMKIQVNPLDYEEFLWAINSSNYGNLKEIFLRGASIGEGINRKLMRDFRLYMAIGGMPQAIDAYLKTNDILQVDKKKMEIIKLYEDDFYKIDSSGRISKLFEDIPAQLLLKKKRFVISFSLKKKTTSKDEELLSDLLDSKTVLPCYDVADPASGLTQSKKIFQYKLYLADTGLFVSLLFNDKNNPSKDLYNELISNSVRINLGYLFENMVAQMLYSCGRNLYYYTWKGKANPLKSYEIDFLTTDKDGKLIPIEVKSNRINPHTSISEFFDKYSSSINTPYIFSQKDISKDGRVKILPFYLLPFVFQ